MGIIGDCLIFLYPVRPVRLQYHFVSFCFRLPWCFCLFLFVCNLAWRPNRPLKPIKQTCQKGTPRGGDGRRERGCSRPHLFLYSFITSWGFPTNFIILTLLCARECCFCIVGAQPYMWWHDIQVNIMWTTGVIGQPHLFSHVFGVFFRWAGDCMSWAHMFRRAGETQTYHKKLGMVLLAPKADDMCAFLCQKKCTWQMTWK